MRRVASPSTSVRTRRCTTGTRSRSSTRPVTRRSPRCAPGAPTPPTSPSSWWRPTTGSCRRPSEAINHARAAEVPIIVAVTKVDREDADPTRVRQQLVERELVPEPWGGDTIVVDVAPPAGIGVEELLESILLVAELEELAGATPKSPPARSCSSRTSTRAAAPWSPRWSSGARCASAIRSWPVAPGARSGRCSTRTGSRCRRPARPPRWRCSVSTTCPSPATSCAPRPTRRPPAPWPKPAPTGAGPPASSTR